MIRAALAAAIFAAAPAMAEDLPPAPDYFVDAVFETTMAQSLALSCPGFSFEIHAASLYSGAIMARLVEDGFDTSTPEGVAVSGFDEKLAARVTPFMARYGLDSDTSSENACRVAEAEAAAETPIARFLVPVGG